MVDRLLGDGQRLEEYPHLAQVLRPREDEVRVLDVVLGQVPVEEVDARS
jgi:hypothetical protein